MEIHGLTSTFTKKRNKADGKRIFVIRFVLCIGTRALCACVPMRSIPLMAGRFKSGEYCLNSV